MRRNSGGCLLKLGAAAVIVVLVAVAALVYIYAPQALPPQWGNTWQVKSVIASPHPLMRVNG